MKYIDRLLLFGVGLCMAGMFGLVSLLPVAAQPTGADRYPVYSFSNINSNTATQVLTGAGILHTVCINDKGASSNIATIYDNTASSGTTVAVIDTVTAEGCLRYDAAVGTGIRIVTATGTAGDLTVTYRALR